MNFKKDFIRYIYNFPKFDDIAQLQNYYILLRNYMRNAYICNKTKTKKKLFKFII